jgi:ATP-binding cassette subfamily B protein RaxB
LTAESSVRLNFGLRRKLPMIHQAEAAECGLACLAMVATYYGQASDLVELRRRFDVSLKGARLSDLVNVATQLGMATRPLRVELDELSQLRTPCVLHWDMNHFVVLESVSRGEVRLHDPAIGVRRMPLRDVSRHFTGVALELTATPGFERRDPPPRLPLTRLFGRIVGLRRSLGHLLVLALGIEVFAILNPFFLQWVIDHALVSADRDLLTTLAIGFSLVTLIQASLGAMRGWTLMVLSASLRVQSSANLFTHLQKLPAAFFESRYLGDIMSRFSSLERIQEALTTELVEAVLDGLMAAITVAIMLMISPPMAALVIAAVGAYALLRWVLYRPLREASMETIVWESRLDSHFLETLRAIRPIKLMGGEEGRRSQWMNLLVEAANRGMTVQKLRLVFRSSTVVLFGLLTITTMWIGAGRILESAFTVGMLLAFLSYQAQFIGRTTALIDRLIDLRMLRLHGERLSDIVLTAPEAESVVTDPPRVEPSLEVRDLRFRYAESEPWILDGVSFRIEAGESVAIVGASGCGKTTLLKILASLLQPTSGEILVGGEPIARLGTRAYREMLGVVMQEDQLFAGSISDNIAFFAPKPDRERIERCAQRAAIHDDIVAMPMAYESLIGDMGTSLSGGQKQRLLLARALYRRPRILMLDEATSHLDVELERAVNAAVRRVGATRIIIAHRPETVRSADRILAFQDGRLVRDERVGRDAADRLDRAGSPPAVALSTERATD